MKYPLIKQLCFFLFSISTFFVFAQNGNIRGTLIEDATGEPLFGVTVQIKGTSTGAITDFDGKFDIPVEAGTYDLQASFVSFKTVTITGIVVTAGEVSLIDQIRLVEDVATLEEIVVTAEVIRTTEAALLTVKRKSANLIDGISAASFKKIGDSDAAGAVKRVTGVSVEGGKYIYVRGLGDRYSKTMLNGVDIPGLDPDKNSIQIDIFPTSLINNMIVSKTASAELPADFTGGLTNIETKDFPDEKILEASAGISFNPAMHFNSDFISAESSGTDFLGFDDGLRKLPTVAESGDFPIPFFNEEEDVNTFVNQFDPKLAPETSTSFLNYSLGFTSGNQLKLKNENTLGYILSLTYRSNTEFYDDQEYGDWQRTNEQDVADFEMIPGKLRTGSRSEVNTLLGGLAGVAYKTNSSKYRFTAMHLQNGVSRGGQFDDQVDPTQRARGKSNYNGITDNLEYNQRGVTNFLLRGDHFFNNSGWNLDWSLSPTFSRIEDPDIRFSTFTIGESDGSFVFDSGGGGFPARLWRFLDEVNMVGSLNVKKDLNAFGRDGNFKFGLYNVYKDRSYNIKRLDVTFVTTSAPLIPWSGDFNDILNNDDIFPNGRDLYYALPSYRVVNSNEYEATSNTSAFYVSTELNPTQNLKAILGVRAENFVQRHTGRDQDAARAIRAGVDSGGDIETVTNDLKVQGENILIDDKVLDALDLFPSANLVYSLNDNQNLRFSYSGTIARPSLKELSFAEIIDPISDRTFIGSLFALDSWDGNLKETRINNFDLRWEMFLPAGQTFSVSAFYKSFDSPIELVQIPVARTSLTYQPRNVGDGQVLGFEFEFRKSLAFIAPTLEKFTLNGNLTIVESQIDMSEAEFEARSAFQKEGEIIENTREMAGQAPILINAGIQYEDYEKGFDAGFFYNVQGETLILVGGSGTNPDVFTEPFHSLNFNLNKSFNDKVDFNFSVTNLLNDRREEFYQAFNAQDQVYTAFSPGITVGLGVKYKFR